MRKCKGFISVITAIILILLFMVAPAGARSGTEKKTSVKNVLLFIGDGMGFPQKTAAEQYLGRRLVMDTLPVQGVTTTYAADRFITGSAAAGTAIACAQKTNIGVIGMAPDLTPVKSVAELAKEQGKKVGIVSSVSIDHATPASFYAHVKSRKMYHEIAHALAASNFDIFAGGGLIDPEGKKSKSPMGDALEAAKKNGYQMVTERESFMKLKPEDGKIIAWNEWLQDSGALPYAMDMRKDKDITLPEFTQKAIEMLSNDKGFFLMVEGGKIDWACHANDATASVTNTLAFDEAVKAGLDFYEKHPEDTLLIVTGDHETGGLTIGFAGTRYDSFFNLLKGQKISFQKFTDEVMKDYRGSFSDLKPRITEYFGLRFEGDPQADRMVLEPHEIEQITAAFDASMIGIEVESKNPKTYLLYGGYDPLTIALTHILNQKAGLSWTSFQHTGVPVGTSAIGVGAKSFNGYYDNTDIGLKLMALMGMEAKVYGAADSLKETLVRNSK